MIWIVLGAAAVVGVIVREVKLAPEVSDDYEIELWEKYRREKYRREKRDEALSRDEKTLRPPEAA